MPSRVFNEKQIEEMVEEYILGATLKDLSEKYGRPIPTIRNTLVGADCPMRSRGRRANTTTIPRPKIMGTGSPNVGAEKTSGVLSSGFEGGDASTSLETHSDTGLPVDEHSDAQVSEGSSALEKFKQTILNVNEDPVLNQYRA